MIELEQLRQLVTFAECGTLSKAAEQLHISQPSLSRTMQALEEELQAVLFTCSGTWACLLYTSEIQPALILIFIHKCTHFPRFLCSNLQYLL